MRSAASPGWENRVTRTTIRELVTLDATAALDRVASWFVQHLPAGGPWDLPTWDQKQPLTSVPVERS